MKILEKQINPTNLSVGAQSPGDIVDAIGQGGVGAVVLDTANVILKFIWAIIQAIITKKHALRKDLDAATEKIGEQAGELNEARAAIELQKTQISELQEAVKEFHALWDMKKTLTPTPEKVDLHADNTQPTPVVDLDNGNEGATV